MSLKLWLDALIRPKQTFEAEKANANLMQGAVHLLIGGIIVGVISAVHAYHTVTEVGHFLARFGLGEIAMLRGIAAALAFFFAPIKLLLGWIGGTAFYYVVAKALRGTGTFTLQAYLTALYLAPLAIVHSLIKLIPKEPHFMWIVVIVLTIALGAYGLSLHTLMIKETHNLELEHALASVGIPSSLIIILMLLAEII